MMSTIATQQDLKRLGLDEFRLGQTALLPWPAPDTSHAMGAGLARATFAAMLATQFTDVPFAAVNDPSVGRFHLETSQTPARVLRVSSPVGSSIQLFAVRGAYYPGETTYSPAEDPGTVYIDAERLPGIVVRAGATGLAISAMPHALEVAALLSPIEVAPLERLEPPVMEWIETLTDEWLASEVTVKARAHNSWSRVVAAGMVARLPVPTRDAHAEKIIADFIAARRNVGDTLERASSKLREVTELLGQAEAQVKDMTSFRPELAHRSSKAAAQLHDIVDAICQTVDSRAHSVYEWHELSHRLDDAIALLKRAEPPRTRTRAVGWVDDLMAGRVSPALAAPRSWIRTLSPTEVRTIEDLSLAEVDALHDAMDMVGDDVDSDASHWSETWRALCHRRDDLECVLVLLDEINKADNLRQSLTGLDKSGEILRLSVPADGLHGDERARRAALKNPDSWWSDSTSDA